jgi:F-type H+-transporting ATPase subunit delta
VIPIKVAKRYARALADFVFEKQEHQAVHDELRAMSELLQENPSLREVFANPIIVRQQKEKLLETLLARAKPSRTTANFLRVLLRHDRLHHLGVVVEAFSREVDERLGIVSVTVTAARALSDAELDRVKQQLERLTGKTVRAEVSVDPTLLGGVTARIGSEIYDGSLKTRIENLRKQLMG